MFGPQIFMIIMFPEIANLACPPFWLSLEWLVLYTPIFCQANGDTNMYQPARVMAARSDD